MGKGKFTKSLEPTVEEIQDDDFERKCRAFGINMRLSRREMGLTSEAFAKFIGVSTAYIGLIERGQRTPSLQTLFRVCEFVGKNIDVMCVSPYETKKPKSPQDILLRKQDTLASMVRSFDLPELEYIHTLLKGLKNLETHKKVGKYEDENGEDEGEVEGGEVD